MFLTESSILLRIKMKITISKIAVLFASMLFVAGCGFTPVYGTSGSGLGQINVAQIDGRIGYLLRQELEKHTSLEQGGTAVRNLDITLSSNYLDSSLGSDSYKHRTHIQVNAHYKLSGTNIIEGDVNVDVGYDTGTNSYSGVTLMANAEERAANLLSDRIWTDIIHKTRH